MKNILFFLVCTVAIMFPDYQQHKSVNDLKTIFSLSIPSNHANAISEISMDSVRGLSSAEAIALCQKVIGTKDDEKFILHIAEERTGREIGYRCDGAIEYADRQYYVLCIMWSNRDDINWSSIGLLGVSSDGNNIYELIEHSDGSYSFGKCIWNA